MTATLRHHTVQVPATSANLGPGYDAFGLALDLYLVVRTRPRQEQTDRVVADGDGGSIAPGDDNLIWRALVAFCEQHGAAVPDVALRAVNRIPLERGLGSSSSAIVAGLVLARALTQRPVGDRELIALATELEGHPDNVAPALLGGLVVCSRDDAGTVVTRRCNPTSRLRPILCVPLTRQSTAAARSVLPDHLDAADATVQASRAGHVLGALGGLWPADAALSGDRLHEPARGAVMVPSAALLADLRSAGIHAWLSGAGPSVAATVPAGTRYEPLAETAVAIASEHGFAAHPLSFELAGAVVCPDGGCVFTGGERCAQCPRERLS